MCSSTWLLAVAIATDGCNVIGRHNSLSQKYEAKLRKHFNAIMEVFYCFTVAIGLPGDASDYNEDKRSAVAACMQNKVVVE